MTDKGLPCYGVREYCEEYPVRLVQDPITNWRLSICARNEGGFNSTLVDLWDLIEWLRFGPEEGRYATGFVVPLDAAIVPKADEEGGTGNGYDHQGD